MGIFSKSYNNAIIIDVCSNLAAIADGDTEILYVVNFNSRNGFRFINNDDHNTTTWFPSITTFEYLVSLKPLLNKVQEYNAAYDDTSLVHMYRQNAIELNNVFTKMGVTVGNKEAFALLRTLLETLRGNLGVLYQKNISFLIPNGFEWFAKTNIAFGKLFNLFVESEHVKSIELNTEAMFHTFSGVEALIRLLKQIGESIDLTKHFPSLFSDKNYLPDLVDESSEAFQNALDDFIAVLVKLVKFLENRTDINALFDSLIKYNSTYRKTNVISVINEVSQLITTQNKLFNNSFAFRSLVGLIQNFSKGEFYWKNVNLSDIVTLLNDNHTNGKLTLLVEVTKKVAPSEINELIVYCLKLLNSTKGIRILKIIIPSLDLSNLTDPGYNIYDSIATSNLAQIDLRSHSGKAVLYRIPVVGTIIERVRSIYGDSFEKIFNGSCILHGIQQISGQVLKVPLTITGQVVNATNNVAHTIQSAIGSLLGLSNAN